MKKIIIAIIVILMLASPAYALQQIAGPLIISVPIGGTGSAQYGLINDGNETFIASLRAEGDVAKYLSFPANVNLEPGKIVYTEIVAKIPDDYDKSLGGNITGFLYSLQEGSPGQVKINIQMKKSVTILIPGLESNPKTQENIKEVETTQSNLETAQSSPITGLFALISSYYFVILLVAIVMIVMLIVIKKRGGEKV